MIEIRATQDGKVIHQVDADTLAGADLRSANLIDADLSRANLFEADLSGANLFEANLIDANLMAANLSRAKLSGAALHRANLSGAKLIEANLTDANLSGANLSKAILSYARLLDTILCDADLSEALLCYAALSSPDLTRANLSRSLLQSTVFSDCQTLHKCDGLADIRHQYFSSLDAMTLRACFSHLPDVFLQGVGYTNEEISTLRALYTTAIRYYSCFLSHAGEDGEFAARLRQDLIAANVTCWHYRYDMHGGKIWRTQINEAIKLHDKLVIVCSQKSLQNINVVDEIVAAIERERETGLQKLFPIALDDFIYGRKILTLADRKMKAQEWREDWVRYVRAFHIPDFSRWKDDAAYSVAFDELLRDLKEPKKREKRRGRDKTRTKK